MRIEVQLDAFTGTKDDEAVVGGAQEILHVAVTGIVAGGSRIGASFAASCVGGGRVARGRKALLLRGAEKSERSICKWDFGDVHLARVWRLIDANSVPIDF